MTIDRPRLGVFVDLENVGLKSLMPAVHYLSEKWEVTIKRAYASDLSEKSQLALHALGFEPIDVRRPVKRKNSIDFVITCDLMEQLFRSTVSAFALVTSDADFIEPVLRVRERLPIYVFGALCSPEELQRAATEFRFLEELKRNQQQSLPSSLDAMPATDELRAQITSHVEGFRSRLEQLTIARLGVQLRRTDPTFNAGRFGARKLSSLVRRLGGFILEELRTESGMLADYAVLADRSFDAEDL